MKFDDIESEVVFQQPKLMGLADLVVSFMSFAQRNKGVLDFPLANELAWHRFLYAVKTKLKDFLPVTVLIEVDWNGEYPFIHDQSDISFMLLFIANTDIMRGRMHLPKEQLAQESEGLETYLPELAEGMFELSKEYMGDYFYPPTSAHAA